MDNPEKLATMGTQNTGRKQTKQKTQRRKLTLTLTPPKTAGESKQFLPLRRHLSCYSYSQYVFGHHYAQTNTNKGNAKRDVSPRLNI